jgi:hypothetical protein
MRFLLFLILICYTVVLRAQVVGDVTQDDIIDANDFLLLKQSVLEGKALNQLVDFDNDNEQTIRDLVLLHNYLYKNGVSLTEFEKENIPEKVVVQFGQFSPKNNTLELIVRSKNLRAFQFELANLDNIEFLKKQPNIYVVNNTIIGMHLDERVFEESLVITLRLNSGITEEYCINSPLFIDKNCFDYKVELGDCANPSWSATGLKQVISDIKNNEFNISSDIDLNGAVDIKDYKVLYDYLYENGETPPGEYSETTERVKMTVSNEQIEDNFLEVHLTSEGKINSFDFSLYGVDTILSVTCSNEKVKDVMLVGNRLIYLGKGNYGAKELMLKIEHQTFDKDGRVCVKSPVVLDSKHQYFQVKLGRCLEVFPVIYGCMDKKATNFNSRAIIDDGSCVYPKIEPKEELVVVKKEKPEKLKVEKTKGNKENEKKTKVKAEKKKVEKKEKVKKEEDLSEEKLAKKEVKKNIEEEKKHTKKDEVVMPKKNIDDFNTTVKIQSLTQDQIDMLDHVEKGKMIYHIGKSTFMVFDGKKWRRVEANSKISIK